MPRSGEDARRRIVAAAERLFAEHGIDGVSLTEINTAAGQRNNSAVQYHFGDRDGVLTAILEKHQPGIDDHRARLLDEASAAGKPSIEDIAPALVAPLAAKLADPDGGPEYLQIQAALLGHRGFGLLDEDVQPAAQRIIDVIPGARGGDDFTRTTRHTLVGTLLFHGLADFARTHPDATSQECDEFVAILTESITGLLVVPSSARR